MNKYFPDLDKFGLNSSEIKEINCRVDLERYLASERKKATNLALHSRMAVSDLLQRNTFDFLLLILF